MISHVIFHGNISNIQNTIILLCHFLICDKIVQSLKSIKKQSINMWILHILTVWHYDVQSTKNSWLKLNYSAFIQWVILAVNQSNITMDMYFNTSYNFKNII